MSGHEKQRRELLQDLDRLDPDLTTIAPPCIPGCSWQRLQPEKVVKEGKDGDLVFWFLAHRTWGSQERRGKLALTEQPWQSQALELELMQTRPNIHRVKVDQGVLGLRDPLSGKPYKKSTPWGVNDVLRHLLGHGCKVHARGRRAPGHKRFD